MRSMVKKAVAVTVVLLGVSFVSHAFAYGTLFPWSPFKPGYAAQAFGGATMYYPEQVGLSEEFGDVDDLLAEVARESRLIWKSRVKVVVADSWGLFNRGALLGLDSQPRPVLGAALQTGTVIYLSPHVFEPDRDLRAVLKHELVHALLFQQMPLRRTFALTGLDWFEEGQAMLFSRSSDPRYMGVQAWRALAQEEAYRLRFREGRFRDGEGLQHVPEAQRGLFVLTEYQLFVAFLMNRYGADRFFRYRDEVLRAPARHEGAFEQTMGEAFPAAVAAFEQDARNGVWPPVNE